MATSDADVRRRTVPTSSPADTPSSKTSTTKSPIPNNAPPASNTYALLEILRALAGLTILTGLASYFLTSGQSLIFNQNARLSSLTSLFTSTSSGATPPGTFTPKTLSRYDGTNPSLPLYVAINRTIYDVSSSPHIYGPGGMYGFFGGKDASRSFVTTCFDLTNDIIPDLEGVEEIYVPLWLSRKPESELKEEWDEIIAELAGTMGEKGATSLLADVRKKLGKKRIAALQEEAYAEARGRVDMALANWKKMLEGKQYPVVGTLIYPAPGTTEAQEEARVERVMKLPLCKDALKNRPKMVESLTKALTALMKDGKVDLKDMAKAQAKVSAGAGKAGAAAKAAAGKGDAGKPRAAEEIKEGIKEKAKEQKKNPHAGSPHGANPHANIPAHHQGAQKPLGHS